jgi:ankyrin repeat protein
MSALAQTLAELDALTTLSEALKERIDAQVAKARVSLERMAVALEDEEGEFKEPKELKELKMLEAIELNQLNHISIFHILLNHNLIQKKFIENINNLEIVDKLLPFVDPSAGNNKAIRESSEKGCVAVVDRLLADPRVDPSVDINCAIRVASQKGHLAVVTRLLQDERVNPSVDNNSAIRWASFNGHVAVVDRLLQARDASGRLCVDPSAKDNEAIRWASANGHVAVVELLKAHGCVLPAA